MSLRGDMLAGPEGNGHYSRQARREGSDGETTGREPREGDEPTQAEDGRATTHWGQTAM